MRKGTYLPNKPAAVWTSRDRLTDGVIGSLTMILRTYGCSRCRDGQGCTMCGFIRDSAPTPPSPEDLVAQFEAAMARRPEGRFMVKIFTSGSFLDAAEMPPAAGLEILRRLDDAPDVIKVLLETRPEFVTSEVMADCRQTIHKKLEVAIGVETSNDRIRLDCINKGFLFEDFVRASRIAHQHNSTVKAYLLLKPPFLSEGVAIRDIVKSVRDVSPYAETVSINLCNVQKGTFVEKLLRRGDYRPPWLWSATSVLRQAKTENPDLIITSDPVGAGSRYGPHNCGRCDSDVANAINRFSISQDTRDLRVMCDCKELWQKAVELEDISYGAPLVS
ncbi:MAG: archaeosine biosynthesis radical SAM protein RaSEA [Methanosarcinales archaeon]|nr:archaeosine biosynthesis radical SAM protein RaSEA [Methanosarcinales archaeon]